MYHLIIVMYIPQFFYYLSYYILLSTEMIIILIILHTIYNPLLRIINNSIIVSNWDVSQYDDVGVVVVVGIEAIVIHRSGGVGADSNITIHVVSRNMIQILIL